MELFRCKICDSPVRPSESTCVACLLERQERAGTRELKRLTFATLLGLLCISVFPKTTFGFLLINYVLAKLFIIPTTIFHELGHAVVARLVGQKVYWIHVGHGKTLYKLQLLGFPITVFRFTFTGGVTGYGSTKRSSRLSHFLVALAGPAANLFAVFILFVTLQSLGVWEQSWNLDIGKSVAPVVIFIYLELYLLFLNLLPLKLIPQTAGAPATDGLLLLSIPFWKDEHLDDLRSAACLAEASDRIAAENFEAAHSWVQQAYEIRPSHKMWGVSGVEEIFQALVAQHAIQQLQRCDRSTARGLIATLLTRFPDGLILKRDLAGQTVLTYGISKAKSFWQEFIECDPGIANEVAPILVFIEVCEHEQLAMIALGKKRYQEAEEEFQHCISLDSGLYLLSNQGAPELNLSAVALQAGEFEKAYQILIKAIALKELPTSRRSKMLNNLADACVYTNRLDEADRYSSEALEQLPELGEVSGTRGTVLICLGRLDEGQELLMQAIKKLKHPTSIAENEAMMALLFAKRNDKKRAQLRLQRARKLDPKNKKLKWVEKQLENRADSHLDVNATQS